MATPTCGDCPFYRPNRLYEGRGTCERFPTPVERDDSGSCGEHPEELQSKYALQAAVIAEQVRDVMREMLAEFMPASPAKGTKR